MQSSGSRGCRMLATVERLQAELQRWQSGSSLTDEKAELGKWKSQKNRSQRGAVAAKEERQ